MTTEQPLNLPVLFKFDGVDKEPWDPDVAGTVDPGELVKQVQATFKDPMNVPPGVVAALLESVIRTTEAFMKDKGIPRNLNELSTNWALPNMSEDARNVLFQLMQDFWHALDAMGYMYGEAKQAMQDEHLWKEVGPDGYTIFYKKVVGPLIDGQCWGPPACHVEAVAAYGKAPMPIMPVIAQPFVTMRAFGVYMDSVSSWWSNLMQSISEAIEEAADVVVAAGRSVARAASSTRLAAWETLKTVAVVGGIVFAGVLLVKIFAKREVQVKGAR